MELASQSTDTKSIRTLLLEGMRNGLYAHAEFLPPETELAHSMGISRTQLRDTLAVLEQEGFITRRHGIGTLINRHVVNTPVRMDIEREFLDIIRASGFHPELAFVRAEERPSDDETAQKLHLTPGTPIVCIERLCTADGRPAIYCVDMFAKDLIRKSYTQQDLEQPIFNFLQQICGVSAYMDLTDLLPVSADESLARLLNIPLGAPLLNMREVDYDISGLPLFLSLQYFPDGFFTHTVLRKKL